MEKNQRLSELPMGVEAIVKSFSNQATGLKMMELGCLPGEIIQVVRKAPLGDPIAVLSGGTLISLRLTEASEILLEPLQSV